jgi:hypothetical protein
LSECPFTGYGCFGIDLFAGIAQKIISDARRPNKTKCPAGGSEVTSTILHFFLKQLEKMATDFKPGIIKVIGARTKDEGEESADEL